MLKLSKNLKVYLYSGFILSAVCMILETLALFFSYSADVNYFETDAIFSVFFRSFMIVTAALFLAVLFLLPKGQLNGESPLTLPVTVVSGVLALIALAAAIIIFSCGSGVLAIANVFSGISGGFISVICGVLLLVAAVYFAFNCFITNDSPLKDRQALVGFAVPISALFLVAISYFDISVSMNAPAKLLFHLSLISFAVWFIYELRAIIGRPLPRCYFSFGLLSMLFSSAASLPWMIAFFSNKLGGSIYPTYIIYNLLSFGMFVYVAVRLWVFVEARSLLERISDQTPSKSEDEVTEEKDV